jgi:DNA-binding CsgD family transcriptional regulator
MTLSDSRNKARALGRIKRLASSGLPLEPFVRSVFELINDAVPHSPNRTFHVGGESPNAYICNSPELNQVVPLHNRYYVESPPQVSGAKFRVIPAELNRRFPSKTIWKHEELTLPTLYRTEGFNVVFKPWGFHHCAMVMFQEAGELVGCYPVWRGPDQKDFSDSDLEFLRSAAPYIAHGLCAARLLERPMTTADDFLPLATSSIGVILLNERGRPFALDPAAQLIFQQLSVLDGHSIDTLASRTVRDGLAYVSRMIAEIFRGTESDSERACVPHYRIYHHWTGIVLRLRGVQMSGADGLTYCTVLVERGETEAARRRRISALWGLSEREAQILSFIGEGKTGPEIALMLGIGHDTVRKHTSKILDKLGVETRTAAAMLTLT